MKSAVTGALLMLSLLLAGVIGYEVGSAVAADRCEHALSLFGVTPQGQRLFCH